MMRNLKILLIAMSIIVASAAMAQKAEKQKKPSLTKVETTVDKAASGEISAEELAKAKEIIDLATEYEKTKDKIRTWYLRGMVYKLMYEKGEEFAGISTTEALTTAGSSFNKASELGKDTDIYAIKNTQEIESLWGNLLNDGVNAYNDGDMALAVSSFEATALVKPNDTTGYLYAASAASEMKDYVSAERNYKKLVELNPIESNYVALISIQKDGLKNYETAAATIAEAKSKLGEDASEVGKYEIDLLIVTKKVQEAIDKIETAVKAEPDNALLHLKQGLLYDQLAAAERKNEEIDQAKLDDYMTKAQKSYQNTIDVDPKNVTAYFNYSIIYNDKANKIYNELNLMGPSEYSKKKKSYEAEARTFLEQALPLMEKAYEIQPEDADVLYALESFYTRLDSKDKLKEVQDKMKALGLVEE